MKRFFAGTGVVALVVSLSFWIGAGPLAPNQAWAEDAPKSEAELDAEARALLDEILNELTPPEVIAELGFDPKTLPDVPPEPTAEQIAILDRALAAYDAEDYKTAHDLWLPLAEEGVAEAQYWMGRIELFGNHVIASHKNAVYWYLKASVQGDPFAQIDLGGIYFKRNKRALNNQIAQALWANPAYQLIPEAIAKLGISFQGNDARRYQKLMISAGRLGYRPAWGQLYYEGIIMADEMLSEQERECLDGAKEDIEHEFLMCFDGF